MRPSRSSRGPEQVSQPAINALVAGAARARAPGAHGWRSDRIPVSHPSQTSPHAAFGHLAGMTTSGWDTSLASSAQDRPTSGRLWLGVTHHPGDSVSCTQAQALVLAAEARTRLRPRRRDSVAPPAHSRARAAGSPNRRAAGHAEASREAGQAAAGRSRATDAGAEASGACSGKGIPDQALAKNDRPAAWLRPEAACKRT